MARLTGCRTARHIGIVEKFKFGVVIANGKQLDLHSRNESSILSDSTKFDVSSVVERRIVVPVARVQSSYVKFAGREYSAPSLLLTLDHESCNIQVL